jgi:hypothetical protein
MINLEQDIIALLNKYSEENTSNNSDFILKLYLSCMNAFNTTIQQRETCYERDDYKSEDTKSTRKEVYDRFDLEQDIFSCWRIVDDIDHLVELVMDRPPGYGDTVSNILIGLSSLYGDRFQKLMDNFEEHIANGKI